MAAVTGVSRPADAVGPAAAGPVRMPLPTRRRRPGLVAVAVLLIVGFGLAGALLYSRAGSKVPVVVAARDVPVGQSIGRADLSTVAIAGPVKAIAAGDIDSVVGRTAATGLVAGQILNRAMLSDQPAVGTGQALVGLSLKAGQLPGDGLAAGDPVEVVQLPGKDLPAGAPATPVVLAETAQVYALRPDDSAGGQTLVTLLVARGSALAVAAAGNAGNAALIKVSP